MAVERWQLCRNREDDNGRCVATKTISQPHAADGWGATYARPGISARSVCVGPEPSRGAQSELIASNLSPSPKSSARFSVRRPSQLAKSRSSTYSRRRHVRRSLSADGSLDDRGTIRQRLRYQGRQSILARGFPRGYEPCWRVLTSIRDARAARALSPLTVVPFAGRIITPIRCRQILARSFRASNRRHCSRMAGICHSIRRSG